MNQKEMTKEEIILTRRKIDIERKKEIARIIKNIKKDNITEEEKQENKAKLKTKISELTNPFGHEQEKEDIINLLFDNNFGIEEYIPNLINIMYCLSKKDTDYYENFKKFITQNQNKELLDKYSKILSDEDFLKLVEQDTEYFNIFIDAIKNNQNIFQNIEPDKCVNILTNFLAYKKAYDAYTEAYNAYKKQFPEDNKLKFVELNQENVEEFLNLEKNNEKIISINKAIKIKENKKNINTDYTAINQFLKQKNLMGEKYTVNLVEIMYYLFDKDHKNSDLNNTHHNLKAKCDSYSSFQSFIMHNINLLDKYSDILSNKDFLELVKQDTKYFNIFIDAIQKDNNTFQNIQADECVKILTNFLPYKEAYNEYQKKFPQDNKLECLPLNKQNAKQFLNDDKIKEIQQKTEENIIQAIKEIKDMIAEWTTDKWRKEKIKEAKTFNEIEFIINTPGIWGGTSRAVKKLNIQSGDKNSELNELLKKIPQENSFKGKYTPTEEKIRLLKQHRCVSGGVKATPNIRPRT